MRAIVLRADHDEGRVAMEEIAEPSAEDGDLLVQAVALGICGTDRNLVRRPRSLKPDTNWLVLGHESLGRVLEAPEASGFHPGQLVVGTVRRPDPMPCFFCESGEPDACENDRWAERGISGRDGFGSERYRLEVDCAVHVDPGLGLAGVLVEPTSIVAKAWEKLDRLVGLRRSRALVLGAGPIGLLAALLSVQRGYEVHVVDQMSYGLKPDQARALGAIYHSSTDGLAGGFDAVMECTGVLTGEALRLAGESGAVCFVAGREVGAGTLPLGRNGVVTSTISSNRRHFVAAHEALRRADPAWLAGLLVPSIPLDQWQLGFRHPPPDGIKAVIRFDTVGNSRGSTRLRSPAIGKVRSDKPATSGVNRT